VDERLASRVAEGLGLDRPTKLDGPLNLSIPADAEIQQYQPKPVKEAIGQSAALSMANTVKDSVRTRKVAILAADGVDDTALSQMRRDLVAGGAIPKVVAPRLGALKGTSGTAINVDFSLLTAASVFFDAVYLPGGDRCFQRLKGEGDALYFVNEAYKHCKPIAATGAGVELLRASCVDIKLNSGPSREANELVAEAGIIIGDDSQIDEVASQFIEAIAQHRHWNRAMKEQVPV
jgi:catalase